MFFKRYLLSLLLCIGAFVRGALHESAHCVVHDLSSDATARKEVVALIEEQYDTVTKDLNGTLHQKLQIYIYPSQEEFHKAMKWENAPAWYMGGVKEGAIHMVSLAVENNNHTPDSLRRLIIQRFAILILFEQLKRVENKPPFWLVRGLSVRATRNTPYWAPYLSDAALVIAKDLHENKVPELKLLDEKYGDVIYSYCAVAYLIQHYGLDKVQALMQDFSRFTELTGVTLEEFEIQLRASLSAKLRC